MSSRTVGSAEPPKPASHVIAHLSDPHLIAGGDLLKDRIDTVANFRSALAKVDKCGQDIDALVISGDLVDRGDEASYELFASLARPAAERLGAELVVTSGNHDERGPLARTLYGRDTDDPMDTVTVVRGLRIITVDSALPGRHSGGFSDAQYRWLATQLEQPAEHGTILVMHHPPIPYRSPIMQLIDFDDPDRLASTLAGSDVRAILAGHLHVTTNATLGGIPVHVAGGVSYVDDVGEPRDDLISVDGPQSWNLIEVHPDTIVSTVAPTTDHPSWPALADGVMDYLDGLDPSERRDAFGTKR